ncbi:MAG: DUF4524 domain-containing protein [Clostridia bacterium]|nr:DUF4524 domain-containing protein [Clostridia bacterium]
MRDRYLKVLQYLKSECEREYKLFGISDTADLLNRAYFDCQPITADGLRLMVRELYSDGYIDLKYMDEEVVLLKPSGKSFLVEKEGKEGENERIKAPKQGRDLLFLALSFLCSFIGALLGGILC